MEKTNKKESKFMEFIKNDDPKVLLILNGITAFLWTFITAMNLYEMNKYGYSGGFSVYISGALALFYIGMSLGYAIKYRRAKKSERSE